VNVTFFGVHVQSLCISDVSGRFSPRGLYDTRCVLYPAFMTSYQRLLLKEGSVQQRLVMKRTTLSESES